MEDLKRASSLKKNLYTFIDLRGDDKSLSNDEYIEERNYFLTKYKNKAPKFLKNCRTLDDFINKLRMVASGDGSWQARRDYLEIEFEEFLNYLEFGESYNEASFSNSQISIVLQKDVFSHVKNLLKDGHFFNAVEESYKIVRNELEGITGEQQAHKAFQEKNYEKLFGYNPKSEIEKDFFEGIKFLHMAIQYLRNEKAHTPSKKIDKNLALHYIVLASLAYDLIDRRQQNG